MTVDEQTVRDMMGVAVHMNEPLTEDECRRALHTLYLADYEVKKRPPAEAR